MLDNTMAFRRSNAAPWRPRRPTPPRPLWIREREATILRLLIEAEREPVHVRQIADLIGISESAMTQFMVRYGEGLWTHAGTFSRWKTTLRACHQ